MYFPTGIVLNAAMVIAGGILGSIIGDRLSEEFKTNLNLVFGACAMTMGVSSITQMVYMPAVILAVLTGTILGLILKLGKKVTYFGTLLEKGMSKVLPAKKEKTKEYESVMITAIVLFCASGTGIYGSMVSGMTNDHSILFAKSFLDLPTATIFACVLGTVTCVIALPQLVIFLALFFLANVIYPLCTPEMIGDFKACGGVLLIATSFRMMKLREFPIADMLPAMILVMPLSFVWAQWILPLL